MAEEALGITVKELKQKRTLAKSTFTKQANFLSRVAKHMTKRELQEEFKKLKSEARTVSETNDEYRAGLLADIEAGTNEGEEAELSKEKQTEVEKTFQECEARLDEVREIVQSNLWPRYGKNEVKSAIHEAETACDGVAQIPVTAVNRDGFELLCNRKPSRVGDVDSSGRKGKSGRESGGSEGIRQQP